MTHDPVSWIDQAAAHQWSVDELRQAIRDAKDPVAEAERARRAHDRVEQAVRKYNEHWAPVTGQRAVLVWAAAKNPGGSASGDHAAALLATPQA